MTDVRSLLGLPELRMRLRTGEELLDREVSRIFVTELPDPTRYLYAGEIVLTGLLWWHGPADAERFVAAMATAGSAALAASGADTEGIPEDLVTACTRHRVPLLEVPPDLSFAVITERVVLALAGSGGTGADARTRLLSTAAAEPSLPTLLEHGSSELGMHCWVLSATGRVVATTSEVPFDPRQLATTFLRQNIPRVVHDDGYTMLPIATRATIPWLLVIAGEANRWNSGTFAVAEELAGLVELDRTRSARLREVADRTADPLFRLAGGGTLTEGELGAALSGTQLTADDSVRVLLATIPGGSATQAQDLLTEVLANLPGRVALGMAGDTACALVEDREWPLDWRTRSEEGLGKMAALLLRQRILVGIGGPTTTAGLRGAGEEARRALEAATRSTDQVVVLSGEQAGMHQLLLAGAPDELRRSLRQRAIGPLLAYDAAQGTELTTTVRTYLECSASPAATAKKLHVHVNTLRYRISRASELLGVDLGEFTNQVDIYLALRSEQD